MKKTDIWIPPVTVSGPTDDLFFDFGKHYFAVLEIETEAEAARDIILAVGEMRDPSGRIERCPGQFKTYQEQTVRLRPGVNRIAMTMTHPGYNKGTLAVEPNAVPFRYAEVRGCTGEAALKNYCSCGKIGRAV